MTKTPRIAIIGAGLYAATLAYTLNYLRRSVIEIDVFESRSVVGGNCASVFDEDIQCHYNPYGAHIFHTNSQEAWDFINKFGKFNGYVHKVKGQATGHSTLLDVPINLNTMSAVLGRLVTPVEAASLLAGYRLAAAGKEIKSVEDWCLANIGPELYEAMVKGYSEKQWGMPCSEIPASVVQRLPVHLNFDTTYFKAAKWQGMPVDGYSALIEQMFRRSFCSIVTGQTVDMYGLQLVKNDYDAIVFTGPLDELFGHDDGNLPYRSLKFRDTVHDVEDFQGTSVVNYLWGSGATRGIEHKHFYPEAPRTAKSLVTLEYPQPYVQGVNQPFYPVRSKEAVDLHAGYVDRFQQMFPHGHIGGRLGSFQYYDMDQTIMAARKKAHVIFLTMGHP